MDRKASGRGGGEEMKTYAIDWEPVQSKDDVPTIQLWYPRDEDSADTIEVELSDVRAADSIRIKYDFERDGWVVLQASVFEWETDDLVCDSDWQEVSFIKAWARQKEEDR